VKALANDMIVMRLGKVVEQGPSERIFTAPQEDYTKALMAAAFNIAGDELDAFLAKTDFLVSLLPLTAETKGILNASLMSKLSRKGPFGAPVLINGGRGGSQVSTDIIAALQSGVLGGASLDVFEQEPLDSDSPFWDLDNVYVTPHVAASSDVKALFVHAEQQMDRFESGLPLEHLVDRTAGY
jgi:glyoxylate/hydroxypyruvate reductase A